MAAEHPNIALLKRLDLRNLDAAADLFAESFVWHYFNPKLPELEGDYAGLDGLQSFFEAIGAHTGGTFKVNPVSATACGDELVVVHVKNEMTVQHREIAIDAVVVWRIVSGRIAEAWDIPSVYAMANTG